MVFDRRKLGNKHKCECGCKFYDMGKEEPVCPRCGAVLEKLEGIEDQDLRLFVSDDSVGDVQEVELVGEEEEAGEVRIVSLSEVEVEKDEEEQDEFE